MCGLIAAFSRTFSELGKPELQRALDQMRRRGPDAEGVWQEPGVALGHRRLAIMDLDARSNQPFHSGCGRYVIAYNGEIYNFRELRSQLAANGVEFRTSSDTEVILALFAKEGEAMLPLLRGMFAFVIWDRVAKRAFAARDAYGSVIGIAGARIDGYGVGLAGTLCPWPSWLLAIGKRARAAQLVSGYSGIASGALRLGGTGPLKHAAVLVECGRRMERCTGCDAACARGA
jgi:hypothetical protein